MDGTSGGGTRGDGSGSDDVVLVVVTVVYVTATTSVWSVVKTEIYIDDIGIMFDGSCRFKNGGG